MSKRNYSKTEFHGSICVMYSEVMTNISVLQGKLGRYSSHCGNKFAFAARSWFGGGCIMHIPLVKAQYITSMKHTQRDLKMYCNFIIYKSIEHL